MYQSVRSFDQPAPAPVRTTYEPPKPQADELTQEDLDGFVLSGELADHVSLTDADERDATAVQRTPREYMAVFVEDLAELSNDRRRFKGKRFVTVENARTVLPPEYAPRDVNGTIYPAVKRVATRTIKGFTPAMVERIKAKLAKHRAAVEARRKALAAERENLWDRWRVGDPDVEGGFYVRERRRDR